MDNQIHILSSHTTDGINRQQRARLADLVQFARTSSPFYRELYRGLPDGLESIRQLPITNKKQLMARFDDWVTDPKITLEKIQTFINEPGLIGAPFLDKYHVAITSGTTGQMGIFITDEATTAVSAKINQQAKLSWLGISGLLRLGLRGIRLAAITATGAHFGFLSGIHYMQNSSPFWKDRVRAFSVHMPIDELVKQLNRFQPTLIMGYASMVALLAGQQELGRLHIHPLFIEVMSEKLSEVEFQKIGKVFNLRPYQMYGSTENPFASSLCKQGWYHVNSDVVILEPVDAEYRPVPAGVMSHSVLVTNLVNKIQPIIRYDLGDSILVKPDVCPCGNPRTAIRVQGRAADALVFVKPNGEHVSVPPLLFVTLIDHMPGIELFQVVQTSPDTLRIRLSYQATYNQAQQNDQWQTLYAALSEVLKGYGLNFVSLERASEPPRQSEGGKFRLVIPLPREQEIPAV
ncbi:MAG: phenylacetate--CoA ligase family protein [Anaerolineae bacterium]|nr:phenylacetate--CoA ligase family protein [Anaerolineae bacterium]